MLTGRLPTSPPSQPHRAQIRSLEYIKSPSSSPFSPSPHALRPANEGRPHSDGHTTGRLQTNTKKVCRLPSLILCRAHPRPASDGREHKKKQGGQPQTKEREKKRKLSKNVDIKYLSSPTFLLIRHTHTRALPPAGEGFGQNATHAKKWERGKYLSIINLTLCRTRSAPQAKRVGEKRREITIAMCVKVSPPLFLLRRTHSTPRWKNGGEMGAGHKKYN